LIFRAFRSFDGKVNIWNIQADDWVFRQPVEIAVARRWATATIQQWAARRVDSLFSELGSPEEHEAQEAFRKDLHTRQDER